MCQRAGIFHRLTKRFIPKGSFLSSVRLKVHGAPSSCSRPAGEQRTGAVNPKSHLRLGCRACVPELTEDGMKKTAEAPLGDIPSGLAQRGQCSKQHSASCPENLDVDRGHTPESAPTAALPMPLSCLYIQLRATSGPCLLRL
uniref:Uncharacterized protein n=1 Tax=Pipistrellus kuhlii TaxID=59472 RepID=A0A7J7WLU5_PIPKU|nr:hypothetical protein mPipKuh1_007941 [Pipistrellus kuhlii]